MHVAADIGCHSFATFAPFSQGNSILGYGMSLASAAAVSGTQQTRPISVMGDGGFWHNGLITGVAGAVFNKDDSVLVVMNNGYSSATGQQDILSSKEEQDGRGKGLDIEAALKSLGVPWIKRVRTYGVAGVVNTLREALRTGQKGLKVIIADGECQLARQRRIRPELREDGGGRQARGAHPLLGRPGGVHRRPLLHPPLGLPLAHHQAQRGPAAHRSRSRTSTTTASAAACAARSRMRRSSAPRSRRSTSSRTRRCGIGCGGRLSAALIRLLGGGRAGRPPSLVPAE